MLNVQLNNRIYNVRWKREKKKRKGREVIDTYCDISKVDPSKEGRNKYTTIKGATGKAYQSPKDNFNKAVGRKIALDRALRNSNKFYKEHRKIFWDTYKKHCHIR